MPKSEEGRWVGGFASPCSQWFQRVRQKNLESTKKKYFGNLSKIVHCFFLLSVCYQPLEQKH
jgi:hypothetical protein